MAASWECPALPMLCLPMKEAGRATFLGLKPMISAHYEENPDSFHEEIKQLDQLRENAMRPSRDYNGISILRRYFAQLHLLKARFPTETIGQLPIDFTWKDNFTGAEYIQEGLQIEQAAVLYNISALHSVLACRSRRDLEQEIKESITHFQCAAGTFNYLDERLAVNHASKDLSPPFVNFYKNLMLGQAQECFVEKSLRGSARVKNSTISKLATRVAEYYSESVRCLETEPCAIIARKYKDWPKLLKIKSFYFQALSHFYQGATCEETGQYGSMIAWHQQAHKKLSSIGRIPKNLVESALLKEAVKNFSDHIQAKVGVAKKQNDQVYHERVPDVETLESVSGTDLVKAVAFHPTDSKNLGTDIFARLVPMRAYEASSVYSERKAELLRSVTSSVCEKDEELEQFLRTLNVEEVEKVNEGPPAIPEQVTEQHTALQGKSLLVKKLHSDLQELMRFSNTVTKDLRDIGECKVEDDQAEAEFQNKYGPRPASQVCAGMWKELDTYNGYHEQGAKSNSELKAMFDQHYRYLVLLSGPLTSLQAAVPRMTPMDAPQEDGRDSDRWKDLLAKIQQMQQQRKMLVSQLRDQINNDDITKNLVGHLGTEADTFIEEQMKKHREVSDVIRQNLAAQENILSAVVDANAGKARVRQAVQDLIEQQDAMFSSLVKAGKFFSILQGKIKEGLDFYSRVHENVSKLRKRVVEVMGTRSRERENVERQKSGTPTPPPSQGTPSTTPSATPPPRPPKKAELAGNPINQTPSDSSEQLPQTSSSVSTPLQPSDSSNVGMSPTNLPAQVVQDTPQPSDLTTPPAPPTGQSLEEQLQELQRQQQLQLQALNETAGTGSVEGYQSTESVTLTPGMPQTAPGLPLSSLQQPTLPPGGQPSEPSDSTPSSATFSPGVAPPVMAPQPGVMGDITTTTNQALLDLQMLLQPPDDSMSSLATPLQPEMSIQPQETTSQEVTDLAMSLQPEAMEPVTGMGSSELTHAQGGIGMGSTDAGLPAPLNPTPPPSQPLSPIPPLQSHLPTQPLPPLQSYPPEPLPSFQPLPPMQPLPQQGGPHLSGDQPQQTSTDLSSLTPQPRGAEIPPQPPQAQELGPNAVWPHQLQPISSPPITEPISEPSTDHLPPVGAGGVDNTLTITSISRPIPTPVLSPPTSPIQSLEPGQDQPLEQEWNADMSPRGGSVPATEQQRQNTAWASESRSSEQSDSRLDLQKEDLESSPSTDRVSEVAEPKGGMENENVNLPMSRPQSELHPVLDSTLLPGTADSAHSGSQVSLDLTGTTIPPHLTSIQPLGTPPGATTLSSAPLDFSHGLDTDLHSLPQLSEMSFQPISAIGSTTLRTPPSVSPLTLETGMPRLSQGSSHAMEHIQGLLNSNRILQQTVEEKSREIEQQKANIADQKSQLENYKQQLLVLQQQLGQVSMQQQKQEQEKATASGQQAVLMQLLQQQQGMFSQQQAQIEKLSKVGDAHRKEQMDMEVKYKQALAVEQEKNSSLVTKNTQQGHELQRLQQQVQTLSQQQQMVQVHLYQYQTQIQERDKQLLAFRNQHKEIIQSLEAKYQQKVTQLVQQIQELQGELKRAKSSHRQTQSPLHMPMQPTSAAGKTQSQSHMTAQQFSQSQQFLPRLPATPSSAQPQSKPIDILTPTSLASPRPHTQLLQPRGPGGLFYQQSSSNPLTAPQQQLQNPLTPQMPPRPPMQQTPPQESGQMTNQMPGIIGAVQQQFRTPLQPTSQQPGHVMQQPGHVMQQPSHMTQSATPNMGVASQHSGLGQMRQVQQQQPGLPQGTLPQLQSQQSVSQASSSGAGGLMHPTGGPGMQGVPSQGGQPAGMLPQPQQMQGLGQPQSISGQYPQPLPPQPPQGQFTGGPAPQPNNMSYHRGPPQPPQQQQPQQIPQGYQQQQQQQQGPMPPHVQGQQPLQPATPGAMQGYQQQPRQ